MNIMITGGAGFIGAALCRYFVTAGERVLNVDCLTGADDPVALYLVENAPNYHFVDADIRNEAALVYLMNEENIDCVIHLAAETRTDPPPENLTALINTNILGTYRLLQASVSYWRTLPAPEAQRFRFHHVTVDQVFGSQSRDDAASTEQSPYLPSSPYAASKAAADHLVRAWHHTFGLPVVLSTSCTAYGPFDATGTLIPTTILSAMEGRPLVVPRDGQDVCDWLHISDCIRALALVTKSGAIGHSYNIGNGMPLTDLALVKTICKILDRLKPCAHAGSHERLIACRDKGEGARRRFVLDTMKIRRALGWTPEETLESGLAKTVAWYLENSWWWMPPGHRPRTGGMDGADPCTLA